MRVLHINCNYIGTTLHQLMIEKLDAMGVENQVFVPTYDKNLSVIKTNKNVLVCECFRKWDRILFDYKQRKIQKALEKEINCEKYDVIHAYTLFTDGNCARRLSEKYGVPYVVAVRNTDVNDFFRLMPHLRKRGIKTMINAKAVFFLSEAYRNQVFEKYVPEKYHDEIKKKTYVIPNGIDDFWLRNPPEKAHELGNTIKLIYAGRIDKNKNITTTQKAMKILRDNGYKVSLTVVGKIADKKVFEIIKADPHTRYEGTKSKEELLELYREHDIFVMPSFTESFGLVYAEAMSQGLPVIYTRGQGFDGQFPEGEVGYSVSSSNPVEVARNIENVVDKYGVISRKCMDLVLKFQWERITRNYVDIYRALND